MVEKKLPVATKKKAYKKPAPVESVKTTSKFQGKCIYCGPATGWATTPACGKG